MSERSSKWAFIVYPDSAPAEWKSILQHSFVASAVSPLHSPEPESGEERKKHYHVLLDYDSLKSFDQVKSLAICLNASNPVIINNPSGYYQYMIHYNNPEKEQFKDGFNAIEKYNGFDSDKLENFTKKQIRAFKADITKIIEKACITEYEVLVSYLRDNNDVENYDIYFDLVTSNTIFFNTYICSRRNRLKKQEVESISKRLEKIEQKIKKQEKHKNE